VEYCPERAGDVKHSMADVSKLAATGFKPSYTFAQGLDRTIEFFKNA